MKPKMQSRSTEKTRYSYNTYHELKNVSDKTINSDLLKHESLETH